MLNLCKTLPLLLFFAFLSACAPVTEAAPTATLQPTASPAPTQPPCSTVASEPTPIPGVDSRFPAVRPDEWSKGPADAAVTIVVYNDFQCLECNDHVLSVLAETHPKDVRLVYRQFPQPDLFTWQVGTVIHEWTHNFLTLRPLGLNYGVTPELRTMNETTAPIVENEIAPLLLARFYPTLTASHAHLGLVAWTPNVSQPDDPPPFDFRAEMRTTRVRADELLADGKIDEAEAYMEARRQFFWDNGYAIRKLNQAYFAFFGAYADVPGGAAGEDPVGPAVRALRAQSASLEDFLNTISWMNSFEDLLKAIGQ